MSVVDKQTNVAREEVTRCDLGGSCINYDPDTGGSPPGWGAGLMSDKDNANFAAIDSLVISDAGFPLYGIRLLLIPQDKLAFEYPINLSSIFPEGNGSDLDGVSLNGGPSRIKWDRRWPVAKTYKIWWQVITDSKLSEAAKGYDKYSMKTAQPGTIWCETTVKFSRPLPAHPGHVIFHINPDGRVDGDFSEISQHTNFSETTRVPGNDSRFRYPKRVRSKIVLGKGMPCQKKISNPYFETVRPSSDLN